VSATLAFEGRVKPAPRVRQAPSEAGIQVTFRYEAADLPTTATIASASASAELLPDGTDTTDDVLESATAAVGGTGLEVSVDTAGGGTAGTRHRVSIESILTDGSVLVDQFVLVLDAGPAY
jgi:hypothetical protein